MNECTPDQMVTAFQRTLNALDLHIRGLEADVEFTYEEYGLIPSDNQFFCYPSTTHGIIQIHQDSAFVCEAILVVGASNYSASADDGSAVVPATDTLTLSIQQMAPKHQITFSRHKAAGLTDNQLLDSSGVSPEAFVPIANSNAQEPEFTNADYFYRLPVEWQIPRGDSVQAFFTDEDLLGIRAGTTSSRYNAVPRVILVGYKVF